MPLHVSSTCAHHQEVKIALHSLWHYHTYMASSHVYGIITPIGVMIPDTDEDHMCSKHVEAWNKLIVKQKMFVHQVG
jgi:hypothetical protein